MSRYIFALLGTGGDVWPGIALAAELHRRRHDVTVLSYGYFSPEAERAGVPFVPIGDTERYLAHISTASFWQRHGTSKGLDEGGYLREALRPVFDYVRARLAERPCLVCTRNAYGARFAAEKFALPIICLAFSPTQFVNAERIPYSAPRTAALPLWMRRISIRIGDQLVNQPLLEKLNPLRETLALPPIRRMREWSFFATPSLALYPAWFDNVSNLSQFGIRQADFVFARSDETAPLAAPLAEFLASGEAPVVVTFGTGVAHLRTSFEKAATALMKTGMRGVFVTPFKQNVPSAAVNCLHVPYADFAALLPRVALLVHHGGIGTAAQALRAGIPQIVIPIAFDQPDNAYRLNSLGVANFLANQSFSAAALATTLTRTLAGTSRHRLQTFREKLLQSNGCRLAADHCEDFFRTAAPAASPRALS